MIKGLIFDLEGVVISTDKHHYEAWEKIAEEENLFFDRNMYEKIKFHNTPESLDYILRRNEKILSWEDKVDLMDRKNIYYGQSLEHINRDSALPGALDLINEARDKGLKTAAVSTIRDTKLLLERTTLTSKFDAVVTSGEITKLKPDSEVYIKAAEKLGLAPSDCLVLECSDMGIEAASQGGFHHLGIGTEERLPSAERRADSLEGTTLEKILRR